jgi:hypothetical protein
MSKRKEETDIDAVPKIKDENIGTASLQENYEYEEYNEDDEPDYSVYTTMKNIREYCASNDITIRISLEEVLQLLS